MGVLKSSSRLGGWAEIIRTAICFFRTAPMPTLAPRMPLCQVKWYLYAIKHTPRACLSHRFPRRTYEKVGMQGWSILPRIPRKHKLPYVLTPVQVCPTRYKPLRRRLMKPCVVMITILIVPTINTGLAPPLGTVVPEFPQLIRVE